MVFDNLLTYVSDSTVNTFLSQRKESHGLMCHCFCILGSSTEDIKPTTESLNDKAKVGSNEHTQQTMCKVNLPLYTQHMAVD